MRKISKPANPVEAAHEVLKIMEGAELLPIVDSATAKKANTLPDVEQQEVFARVGKALYRFKKLLDENGTLQEHCARAERQIQQEDQAPQTRTAIRVEYFQTLRVTLNGFLNGASGLAVEAVTQNPPKTRQVVA